MYVHTVIISRLFEDVYLNNCVYRLQSWMTQTIELRFNVVTQPHRHTHNQKCNSPGFSNSKRPLRHFLFKPPNILY
jgi:hypothetical protein